MSEMYLRQPGFTYSACWAFTKNEKRIQKLKKHERDSRYIYQNELDKTHFEHDMDYLDFKDLPWRIASDKIFCDKALNIAKNLKHDRYQRVLSYQWFTNFLIRSLQMKLCQTNI